MTAHHTFEFAGFRFEPHQLRLVRGDRVEALNGKAAEVLLVLVRHPRQLVTKQALLSAVWPDVAVEENNLSQQISSLRKALGPGGDELIETVPRHGYRLVADVRTVDATELPLAIAGRPPAAGSPAGADTSSGTAASSARGRWIAAAIAVALVAGGGFWARKWWQAPKRESQALIDRAEALLRQGDAKTAASEFQNAIRLDPTNARAHASLANALHRYSTHASTSRAADASPALEAAERSVALDPACGECHGMLGFILTYHHWQWSRAESHLLDAIRLAPDRESIRPSHAMLLAATGRVRRAIEELDLALAKRPYEVSWLTMRGTFLYLDRRYTEALESIDRALAIDDANRAAWEWRSRILFQTGRGDEAIRALAHGAFADQAAALEQAVRDAGAEGGLRHLLAITGDWRSRTEQSWRRGPWRLLLGDVDGAFAEWTRAYEMRNFNLIYAAVDPAFDRVRDDPRFQQLLVDMGLSPTVVPITR